MRRLSHAGIAIFGAVALIGMTVPGFAQETLDASADLIDEIIVTGSRIKRDTYTSIPPLQIINADESREAGLIDAALILHETVAVSGPQVDRTVQSDYSPDGGPGSSSINLRGLGDARTLVLVNGRRIGPAGVEGAPAAADLNLVPSVFVRQYDLLLDGASSIYGSDAVAGVTNIILRRDFDGFEAEVFTSIPQQSGGVEKAISMAWGRSNDRGFIGIGAEYQQNQPVLSGDRRWTSDCWKHREIDENGQVRKANLKSQIQRDQPPTDCKTGPFAGRIQIDDLTLYTGGIDPGPDYIYYTPGITNTGIPNFSDSHSYLPGGLDGDGDGVQDIIFSDYSYNLQAGNYRLYPEFERTSAMAYGEYTKPGAVHLTTFFEIQHSRREVETDTGSSVLYPTVPAGNPFNPCNPNGLDGVDCAVAWNYFYTQQTVIDTFTQTFGVPPSAFGLGMNTPVGAIPVTTNVSIPGDRHSANAEVAQTRAVAGVRGDLGGWDRGDFNNWSFEIALVTSRSRGESKRLGIRQDWLYESLMTSAVDPVSSNVVCGIDTNNDGIPDGVNADGRPCVPINMFAASLYENLVGGFATQAERDYLFDSRDFKTDYDQWLVTGLLHGTLFELPAGPVAAVFGIEYRDDEIRSIPDDVASEGLFFSFFSDGGAIGSRYTRELFAEIEWPLLENVTAAKELVLNTAARYTKDQYYGSDTTYSAKLGWRPVDSLLVRATFGTSFRAPNLNESFRVDPGSGAWYWIHDPCAIPPDAYNPITGYDPSLDPREAHVLQNCANNGVDPTTFWLGGNNWYQVNPAGAGTTNLHAETSESFSYGFVWDQPFTDAFNLTLGASYYEIDVADTIVRPTPFDVLSDCYESVNLNSALCSRIVRDPGSSLITDVSRDYINRDEMLASGIDVNVHYSQPLTLAGRPFDLSLDLALNHPREVSETFPGSDGSIDFDDWAGEWGYPDWKGNLSLRVDISSYRVTWQTRYIGAVQQDPAGLDEWSDIDGVSDTCLGPSQGDVLCRDVGFADEYFVHNASLFYHGESWTLGAGVRNVFDTAPPKIDDSELFLSHRNVPLGYGYDINGRTWFINIQARLN